MGDVLDAIPAEARGVIVDELTRRDPALLAELRNTQEPTTEQSDAVNHLHGARLDPQRARLGG
jgi:hypothetical protein